jgi:hypothetical protein
MRPDGPGRSGGHAAAVPQDAIPVAGIIAGPFFGPGVFLTFWNLDGEHMNKLIFTTLVLLGATPSFALYLSLLYLRARRGDPTA